MARTGNIPWKQLFTEGAVIVVSILLAFAIDAWWDKRQQLENELEQLERVRVELGANSDRLERKLVALEEAIDATTQTIGWMGPEPVAIGADAFGENFERMVGIGTLNLTDRAAVDYLAAGAAASAATQQLRFELLDWHDQYLQVEQQYGFLREHHAAWMAHLQRTMPLLNSIGQSRFLDDVELRSKFPFETSSVLSDPTAESLFSTYLARLVIVVSGIEDLRDEQVRLHEQIGSVLAKDNK